MTEATKTIDLLALAERCERLTEDFRWNNMGAIAELARILAAALRAMEASK